MFITALDPSRSIRDRHAGMATARLASRRAQDPLPRIYPHLGPEDALIEAVEARRSGDGSGDLLERLLPAAATQVGSSSPCAAESPCSKKTPRPRRANNDRIAHPSQNTTAWAALAPGSASPRPFAWAGLTFRRCRARQEDPGPAGTTSSNESGFFDEVMTHTPRQTRRRRMHGSTAPRSAAAVAAGGRATATWAIHGSLGRGLCPLALRAVSGRTRPG